MTGKSKYPLSTKRYTLLMEEHQPEQRQDTDEGGKLVAGEVEEGEGDNPFHVGILSIKTDTVESLEALEPHIRWQKIIKRPNSVHSGMQRNDECYFSQRTAPLLI